MRCDFHGFLCAPASERDKLLDTLLADFDDAVDDSKAKDSEAVVLWEGLAEAVAVAVGEELQRQVGGIRVR